MHLREWRRQNGLSLLGLAVEVEVAGQRLWGASFQCAGQVVGNWERYALSGGTRGCLPTSKHLAALMAATGLTIERVPGRPSLVDLVGNEESRRARVATFSAPVR
jgi:hypothetical protein